MILSRKWLNEFVPGVSVGDIDDKEFAEALTLSGSKVETVEDQSAQFKNVVVGKVLSMERHPNSDHMWVVQIDIGEAGSDLHRSLERTRRRSGTCRQAQLPAARRGQDHQGQAERRTIQRHALRSVRTGTGRP